MVMDYGSPSAGVCVVMASQGYPGTVAKGKVIVYENGKQQTGSPRLTPLLPHADIQLDVGQPAVALYMATRGGECRLHALHVLTIVPEGVSRVVAYQDPNALRCLNLLTRR